MCDLSKKDSFTLIEIVVVLIILGVLAAIALPNLFSNIDKSKFSEPLVMQGMINKKFDLCFQRYTDLDELALNCSFDSTISSNNYGVYTPAGSRFTYQIDVVNPGASPIVKYDIYIRDQSVNPVRVLFHKRRKANGVIDCPAAVDPFTILC